MNNSKKYMNYALCREMRETPGVIRTLDTSKIKELAKWVNSEKILLSGEGSSRIFPAKNWIYTARKSRLDKFYYTEGARQASEYPLNDISLFVSSNSGKTREAAALMQQMAGKINMVGITAHNNTPISETGNGKYILECGVEDAVAATKSVIEQALFYDILFRSLHSLSEIDLEKLADSIETVLDSTPSAETIDKLVAAENIYWAGRNNGVGEELKLKTNEIVRKKADFFEGTYILHGVEEVMRDNDAVILINPFDAEMPQYKSVIENSAGIKPICLTTKSSGFTDILLPLEKETMSYIELAAGWNLLAEVGIALGINLDKPERARKIGNSI